MCRSTLVLALTLLSLVALAPRLAVAGTPLTGTASCGTEGRFIFGPYLPLVTSPHDFNIRLKGKLQSGTCDGTGVTGGRAPLRKVTVSLRGIMPQGTDCESFLDSIAFSKSAVTVKWQGINDAGRTVALGSSKSTVESASYDSGAERFVITTAPIAKGAFLGSTLSIALPLGDLPEYTRVCNLVLQGEGGFSTFNWGPPMNSHTVTVTVQ